MSFVYRKSDTGDGYEVGHLRLRDSSEFFVVESKQPNVSRAAERTSWLNGGLSPDMEVEVKSIATSLEKLVQITYYTPRG